MRGLTQLRSAKMINTGHAFVQNLRRSHYGLGIDADSRHLPPPHLPNSLSLSEPHPEEKVRRLTPFAPMQQSLWECWRPDHVPFRARSLTRAAISDVTWSGGPSMPKAFSSNER